MNLLIYYLDYIKKYIFFERNENMEVNYYKREVELLKEFLLENYLKNGLTDEILELSNFIDKLITKSLIKNYDYRN